MEIEFKPWKHLEIRSYNTFDDVESFAQQVALPIPAGAAAQTQVFWANSVLFRFQPIANSEAISKEYLAGRLIWDTIDVAPMPKYAQVVTPQDKPAVTIRVVNVSSNPLFDTFTKWVGKELLKNKSRGRRQGE